MKKLLLGLLLALLISLNLFGQMETWVRQDISKPAVLKQNEKQEPIDVSLYGKFSFGYPLVNYSGEKEFNKYDETGKYFIDLALDLGIGSHFSLEAGLTALKDELPETYGLFFLGFNFYFLSFNRVSPYVNLRVMTGFHGDSLNFDPCRGFGIGFGINIPLKEKMESRGPAIQLGYRLLMLSGEYNMRATFESIKDIRYYDMTAHLFYIALLIAFN